MPRPIKPENARFDAAGDTPAVYLVEVGCMVKVGHSRRPRLRLRQLDKRHRKDGELLGSFLTFPGLDESDCISALKQQARLVPRRREYFVGIQLAAAAELLSVIAHGREICPRVPLNTTQRSGVML